MYLKGFLRPCYQADNGGGTGGQGGDPAPAPAPAPNPSPAPDVQASFDRLLSNRGGDSSAVGLMLYQENYQLRERRRQLEEENTQLRAKLPGEGAIVLNRAEAQRWQAYQALGNPEEVQTSLTELQTLRRNGELSQIAEVVKYKPSVFQKLDKDAGGLAYEVKEIEENGKKEKRAFVTVKDQAGAEQTIPLQQYAEQHWSDFLPALRNEQQAAPSGTDFVRQNPGGGAPANSAVDQFLQRQKERRESTTNPLMSQRKA